MNQKQAPSTLSSLLNGLDERDRSKLLPNICQNESLFFLILLTQIFVIVFTLLQSSDQFINFESLGIFSLFSHGLVLSSALALCFYRRVINPPQKRILILHVALILGGISWTYASVWASLVAPTFGILSGALFIEKTVLICMSLGGVIIRYLYLQSQWHAQKNAEITARVEALQARIRPHFLFNSMNSIASLILSDPEQAEEAVLNLSELFRATLQTKQPMIPFSDELSLCKRYIAIEHLRLGNRLSVEWKIDPSCLQVSIPQLTLQPILENAIYHGIQPLSKGGSISINCYTARKSLYVMVSNPYQTNPARTHQGNQIATENIRSRLEAIFGEAAIFKSSQQDDIYTVTLRIPVRSS